MLDWLRSYIPNLDYGVGQYGVTFINFSGGREGGYLEIEFPSGEFQAKNAV
jgi:hypothetical protein